MRKAISFIALSVLAAACGGGDSNPQVVVDAPPDEAPPIDQPPVDPPPMIDTSCANNPEPTTATDPVTLVGDANGLTINIVTPQISALPDATITACVGDCQGDNALATTTSQANGCPQTGCPFTINNLATGGLPLNGYLKVEKATFRTSNIFPSEPIRSNLDGVPALALSNAAVATLETANIIDQDDTVNGMLAIVVTDCALTPVPNAIVSVTQNGTPVGEVFDVGSIVAQLGGTFLVTNVPAGIVTVSATVNGVALRSHDVESFVGQTTGTQITPGFAP